MQGGKELADACIHSIAIAKKAWGVPADETANRQKCAQREQTRRIGGVGAREDIAQAAVTYGMELMTALFSIAQGAIQTIMGASGLTAMEASTLPAEIASTIEDVGLLESIPLWAVTLLGSLFIWVLSLVMILTVYGRFFKLYMATAIAPIPLSSFAGQPSSSIGMAFIKSYAAICLEGCVILLACVIFSQFASSLPVITEGLAPATVVWNYIGELVFNMLVLVGSIKMSDRIIRELMGLG